MGITPALYRYVTPREVLSIDWSLLTIAMSGTTCSISQSCIGNGGDDYMAKKRPGKKAPNRKLMITLPADVNSDDIRIELI